MKTIAVGDIHGRDVWKAIYEKEKPDRMIFVGDYFDSFNIPSEKQQNNFLDICAFKKSGVCDVILLIGNHDHHYFHSIGNTGTSGYQGTYAPAIGFILEDNKHLLQMVYQQDNILFSHAGVGECFLDAVFGKDGWKIDTLADDLNDLWKYKPRSFIFNGRDGTGDDMGQTPIWIRPRSLMKDSQVLKKSIIQVVGHTGQYQIDIKGKATGGRYYFIDTLGTSKEYLIIRGPAFKTGKYE